MADFADDLGQIDLPTRRAFQTADTMVSAPRPSACVIARSMSRSSESIGLDRQTSARRRLLSCGANGVANNSCQQRQDDHESNASARRASNHGSYHARSPTGLIIPDSEKPISRGLRYVCSPLPPNANVCLSIRSQGVVHVRNSGFFFAFAQLAWALVPLSSNWYIESTPLMIGSCGWSSLPPP